MSEHDQPPPPLDIDELRQSIQDEYAAVALDPGRGFHFHTGRPLAGLLGYADDWLNGIPEASVASFAGTGNPFSLGALRSGEQVVDIGCGAGLDSLIASTMVGPAGHVIGVDMARPPAPLGVRSAVRAQFAAANSPEPTLITPPPMRISATVVAGTSSKAPIAESPAAPHRTGSRP